MIYEWSTIISTQVTLPITKPIMTIIITITIAPDNDGLFSLLSNAIVMVISSVCLGTMLHIELNGLKMNQLFGISRLTLRSILKLDFIDVS